MSSGPVDEPHTLRPGAPGAPGMADVEPPDRLLGAEAQVRTLLDAVEVRPPSAYMWFGQREDSPRAELEDRLRDRLVRDFFRTGAPLPPVPSPLIGPDDGGELVRALSQANGGRGAWQGGWRISSPTDGDGLNVVSPDGLRVVAPADDCRIDGQAAAGATAEVRLPKELRGWRPGAYVALGDTPPQPGAERVGLYWNIAVAGAVTLVARLTYTLNGAGIAFVLELPDNPGRYDRRDSAVLSVARSEFAAVAGLVRPLLRPLGPHLADGAPAFTKPLTRGLAVAELPADETPFGAHRCGLVAAALVAAGERGLREPAARMTVVCDHFAAAGLSLAAAYLQPGSDDAYALA